MARPVGSKSVNFGANIFIPVGDCVVQLHQAPDGKMREMFYDENGVYQGHQMTTIKKVLCYFNGATRKDWMQASEEARAMGIRPIILMKQRFLK